VAVEVRVAVSARIAAVDIGTNTVRLLVAEEGPDGLRDIHRQTIVVGLGRGLEASDILGEEAMARTVAALETFGEVIEREGVAARRAVATSASRDAANRDEFLDRAEEALGFRPEVISGEEEASLGFAAATTAVGGTPPFVVIDPGGGSTEFVFGTDAPQYVISIDMGSVRLTDRALPDRPAPAGRLDRARTTAADALSAVALPGAPGTVIGVAGTFTSLAAMHQVLTRYDRERVHGTVLSSADLDSMVGFLAGLTEERTAAIPSLDPARAPVILAGAVVAAEALRAIGAGRVVVSEADMLDGVALGLR
jgi:exopolyphosphatase/guanosine-5'-triphosphate,3'-diphosphate pyrophosphatase